MRRSFYSEMTIGRAEFELYVTGDFSPYIPARTLCSPDNASPAEGGHFEIHTVEVYRGEDKPLDRLDLPSYMLEALETEGYEYFAGEPDDA